MNRQKIYTTFGFFKMAAAAMGLAVLVAILADYALWPGVLVPALLFIGLTFAILSFRILQLIYKLQLDRVHDVNQVESMMWLYQQFQPKLALPPMRVVAGSPDFFKVIVDTYLQHQPKVVVEAGSGVSSIVLSELLLSRGSTSAHYALDHLHQYAQATESRVNNPNSKVVFAPLKSYTLNGQPWQWYSIDALQGIPPIDLLIIDGPPENIQKLARYPALPLLWEQLSPQAVIILDDANRKEDRAVIERWKKEYPLEEHYWYTEKGTVVLTRQQA